MSSLVRVGAVVAHLLGDSAERRRVLGPQLQTENWKGVLVAGGCTAEEPLSKVPRPRMLQAPVLGSLLTLCHLLMHVGV